MANSNPSGASSTGAQKKSRGISGTAHPYFDLDAGIKVAEVIHKQGGGAAASDQLAAWLDYASIKSGTYLTRIAAARQFGLIESVSGGLAITDRGRTILAPVMPDDSLNAKVDAFLDVELFAKVYEQFKGASLPPEAGLKNLFLQTYKILPDRVPQAVRVFLNSAEQAGFFKTTGDRTRLVKPTPHTVNQPATPDPQKKDEQQPSPAHDKQRAHVAEGPAGVHSAIIGLLRDLPPPGTTWSPKKKLRFLDAFKAAVDHIYPEDDE
jgi:hypothetical protein